jgi:type IV pilus assembly protein PilV
MRPLLPRRRQDGATLIEVLISLFLVAFVMLGLLGLQLRSAAFQKDSFDRRKAATLVAAFGERVAANYEGFEQAAYSALAFNVADLPPTAVTACANCSNAQVAARDWDQFRIDIRRELPGGIAFLDTPPNLPWLTVVVGWEDPRRQEGETVAPIDPVCASVGVTEPLYRCYMANIYP